MVSMEDMAGAYISNVEERVKHLEAEQNKILQEIREAKNHIVECRKVIDDYLSKNRSLGDQESITRNHFNHGENKDV